MTRNLRSKYLNNRIEQDHRASSDIAVMSSASRDFRNAAIMIAGIEATHRIRKGQIGLGRWGFKWSCAYSLERGAPGRTRMVQQGILSLVLGDRMEPHLGGWIGTAASA